MNTSVKLTIGYLCSPLRFCFADLGSQSRGSSVSNQNPERFFPPFETRSPPHFRPVLKTRKSQSLVEAGPGKKLKKKGKAPTDGTKKEQKKVGVHAAPYVVLAATAAELK